MDAAMEPAVDRREHHSHGVNAGQGAVPQWSPPLIGGSTDFPFAAVSTVLLPQWSPPLIGGSTASLAALRECCQRRNGARR